mgnify:CR=1 FL=1
MCKLTYTRKPAAFANKFANTPPHMLTDEQVEELDILHSMFDMDGSLEEIEENVYRFRVGSHDESKAIYLRVGWSGDYPATFPLLRIDDLDFVGITPDIGKLICDKLLAEEAITQLLGTPMTYDLVMCLKEHWEDWMKPDVNYNTTAASSNKFSDSSFQKENSSASAVAPTVAEDVEYMSKTQKRKYWNKATNAASGGDRERGWNWVDIISHLHKTG